jgi:hypothetical protein
VFGGEDEEEDRDDVTAPLYGCVLLLYWCTFGVLTAKPSPPVLTERANWSDCCGGGVVAVAGGDVERDPSGRDELCHHSDAGTVDLDAGFGDADGDDTGETRPCIGRWLGRVRSRRGAKKECGVLELTSDE